MPDLRTAEYQGWQAKAAAYEGHFGLLTAEVIPALLDGLDVRAGGRLLDVACGSGQLVAAAAARGHLVEGVDFAPNMIEIARRLHPDAAFGVGDATALPYSGRSFDAVSCAFGLMHLEWPELAVAEAWRVLEPGGRYALTAWCSGEQGSDFFRIVSAAVEAHAEPLTGLAAAPPMFRFADRSECQRVLGDVGFIDLRSEVIPIVYRPTTAAAVFEMIVRSTVRTALIIDRQSASRRAAIKAAIEDGVHACQRSDGFALNMPALLFVATKPEQPPH